MRSIAVNYRESSKVAVSTVDAAMSSLEEYRKELEKIAESGEYLAPESSINLPFDEAQDIALKKATSGLARPKLKLIIVVGIGGSTLGSFSLYSSRYGWADAFLQRTPKLLYLDAISPMIFNSVDRIVQESIQSLDELLVLVVSKSGNTVETIANAEALIAELGKHFGNTAVHDRVVYLADESSILAQQARAHNWNLIHTAASVGGRFSVFSLPHLIPLTLAGINCSLLLEGARDARISGLSADPEENDALSLAAVRVDWENQGLSTHNLFIFAPQCAALGSWWRQLQAESLGKEKKGMVPTVTIGSTDLHSVAQFYLGGSQRSATTFISVEKELEDLMLPQELVTGSLVPGLAGKSFSTITRAILDSTEEAYRAQQVPFAKIIFPEVNERALGAWMQMEMLATMYAAKLMGVNAFDQPNVEDYKAATRARLIS